MLWQGSTGGQEDSTMQVPGSQKPPTGQQWVPAGGPMHSAPAPGDMHCCPAVHVGPPVAVQVAQQARIISAGLGQE